MSWKKHRQNKRSEFWPKKSARYFSFSSSRTPRMRRFFWKRTWWLLGNLLADVSLLFAKVISIVKTEAFKLCCSSKALIWSDPFRFTQFAAEFHAANLDSMQPASYLMDGEVVRTSLGATLGDRQSFRWVPDIAEVLVNLEKGGHSTRLD